jgi:hypothetical protein
VTPETKNGGGGNRTPFETPTRPFPSQVITIVHTDRGCCNCGNGEGRPCGYATDVDRAVTVRYEAKRRPDSASPYRIPASVTL